MTDLAGGVTGIGSLPFRAVEQAIRAVAELSQEIPFWPQLPQLSERENMISQGLGVFAGLIEPRQDGPGYQVRAGRLDDALALLHDNDGALMPTHAAGFTAFADALAGGAFPSAAAVKGQVAGPITLATCLFHDGLPFLAEPALFAALAAHVSRMACWQIDSLRGSGLPVVLFVDEPALGIDATTAHLAALADVLDVVRRRGALAGLHCCATPPFDQMCQARPDMLSFDAHDSLDLFFANRSVKSFLRDGGCVAYGLIPTGQCLDGLDSGALFDRWLQSVSQAGDPGELARRSMITATCGLGLSDEAYVGASFRLAREIGTRVRALATTPARL